MFESIAVGSTRSGVKPRARRNTKRSDLVDLEHLEQSSNEAQSSCNYNSNDRVDDSTMGERGSPYAYSHAMGERDLPCAYSHVLPRIDRYHTHLLMCIHDRQSQSPQQQQICGTCQAKTDKRLANMQVMIPNTLRSSLWLSHKYDAGT